jgi:hypothetical protein
MTRDNGKGTCLLTGTAISADRNVIKKEVEMILKHKDLTKEMQRIWNAKNESDINNKSRRRPLENHSENT